MVEEIEDITEGIKFKKAFSFLFPPRSSVIELIVNIIVTALYTFIVVHQAVVLTKDN